MQESEGCCISVPQERSSSCQSINNFPIPRESSFSLAESPFGAMAGTSGHWLHSQPLGRSVGEPKVKEAGNQHVWGVVLVVKQCLYFI